MQDNESVLLTAGGKNGKVELTETSVIISEYKRGLTGWNKSKINKVYELPRDAIISAEVVERDFYIFMPNSFPGADYRGCFTVSIDVEGGYRPEFEDMAAEIGLQGRWYENDRKLSHTESYESEEQASLVANRAAKKGWRTQSTSSTRSTFLGTSRPNAKFTVTYERTPEWLASNNKAVSQSSVLIPQSTDDPLQKMKQLKGMLDAGLISESEYNAKKTDLLSKM